MSTSAENKASVTQVSGPTAAVEDMKKKIMVRTADGEVFELKKDVAMEIAIVKSFFQEDTVSYETVMPIPNVQSWEMAKLIEYCNKNLELKGKADGDKELKAFQAEFINDQSTKSLLRLANVANYLEVKYFLDFLCQTVADRIKNKTVEYVRDLFGVENDFSPEEYDKVCAEAPWCFEGLDDD